MPLPQTKNMIFQGSLKCDAPTYLCLYFYYGGKMKKKLLKPDECYLHIIDPQQSLMAHIHLADRVTAVIKLMLACARILSIPVIANTQYKKGLGEYVAELEPLMEGIQRPDKTEFSALANEQTKKLVDQLPDTITTPILVGVETHICIYQTATAALEQGLVPWVVADGVSSRTVENHELGLDILRSQGAIVGPAEMIVYELLGKAGTPQFKEILPFILDFSKNIR
jgi:nicotinamidase-related amidase